MLSLTSRSISSLWWGTTRPKTINPCHVSCSVHIQNNIVLNLLWLVSQSIILLLGLLETLRKYLKCKRWDWLCTTGLTAAPWPPWLLFLHPWLMLPPRCHRHRRPSFSSIPLHAPLVELGWRQKGRPLELNDLVILRFNGEIRCCRDNGWSAPEVKDNGCSLRS